MNQPRSKPNNSLFLFPDPITHVNQLSGACFLYFERPLLLTVPPDVITTEAFELQEMIKSKRPSWANAYFEILFEWLKQKRGCKLTLDLLDPLSKIGCYETVYLAYAANFGALERVDDMFASARFSLEEASSIAYFPTACSEFVRHIHLERYLELGKDIGQLYVYCDEIFKPDVLDAILLKSYFFRSGSFGALAGSGKFSVMLTNEKLLDLFNRMPVEQENPKRTRPDLTDVAGWEIFRRLISPHKRVSSYD